MLCAIVKYPYFASLISKLAVWFASHCMYVCENHHFRVIWVTDDSNLKKISKSLKWSFFKRMRKKWYGSRILNFWRCPAQFLTLYPGHLPAKSKTERTRKSHPLPTDEVPLTILCCKNTRSTNFGERHFPGISGKVETRKKREIAPAPNKRGFSDSSLL